MKWKRNAMGILALSLIATSSVMASSNQFKDVEGNYWAKSTISWAVDNNMVKGYPDGTFKPENRVTEAEFLTMLIRAIEDPQVDLNELDNKSWPIGYYDFAQERNYPVSKNQEAGFKRAEVAELVAATQGVNATGDTAIKWLLVNGLATGKVQGLISVENYKGSDILKRSEAVQFIKNAKEKGLEELKERPFTPVNEHDIEKQYQEFLKKQQPEVKQPEVTPKDPIDRIMDSLLLEADPVTQPAIESFIQSVRIEGNKVKGVVPEIPEGQELDLRYVDTSNGLAQLGNKDNDRNFSHLESGDTFEVIFEGQGGYIMFGFYKGVEGTNSARIDIPSMDVWRGNKT